MKIRVNSKEFDLGISSDFTVSRLLEHLKLQSLKLVVEKNEIIIDESDYLNEIINDGDIIEIVKFVGGG